MTFTIKSNDANSITLCENNVTKSVLQNIFTILNTPKGTVPGYREFGLQMDFLDKPVEVAETLLYARITEAIAMFEPRASVKSASFQCDKTGKIIIILEVEI